MKKPLVFALLLMCCFMTACSAKPAGQNETTPHTSEYSQITTQAEETTVRTEIETIPANLTDPPTDPPTEPPTDPPKDTKWKQLYIDYINTLDHQIYNSFELINIDDDDIPELAVFGNAHISPSYLCWVYNGDLCKGNISFSGFKYFEGENKYLCEDGFTGSGWDTVKRINGYNDEEVIKGDLCNIKGQEHYTWDGVDYPNQEAYESAKNRDFDKSKAQEVNNAKTYSEICELIRDY